MKNISILILSLMILFISCDDKPKPNKIQYKYTEVQFKDIDAVFRESGNYEIINGKKVPVYINNKQEKAIYLGNDKYLKY